MSSRWEALDLLLGSLQIEIICSGPVFCTFSLPFASWKTCDERCIVPRQKLLSSFFSVGILFWACLKYPVIYVLLRRNCKSSCPNFNWLPIFQAHISLLFKIRLQVFYCYFSSPSIGEQALSSNHSRCFEDWDFESFYQTQFAADSCIHVSTQIPFLQKPPDLNVPSPHLTYWSFTLILTLYP